MLQLTITIGKLPRLCRPEKAREEISNLSSICSGLFCDFLLLAAADWHGIEGKKTVKKKWREVQCDTSQVQQTVTQQVSRLKVPLEKTSSHNSIRKPV